MTTPHDTQTITPIRAQGPEALGDLVRQAVDTQTPIVDYGKYHQRMGHTPPASHYKLTQSTDDAGAIIDHYDRDMTVRANAAATIGQIQTFLKQSNQYIPIDADLDLTLGEIINTNTYGPLRLSMGALRDLLLGLHYIDGNGNNIQVGGRTVKNVAGLDVTRLMVGSLGELGLIHQAALRTYAIPEHVLTVDLALEDPRKLDTCLTDWLLTDANPASLMLERTETDLPWCLRLAYHGKASACHSQLHSLQAMIESIDCGMAITGSASQKFELDLAEHSARRRWQRESNAVVKIIVPPASTGSAMMKLDKFNHEHGKLMLNALPAFGCIHAGGNFSAQQAQALNQTVNEIVREFEGSRSWISRPAGSENDIAPFAPMPPALPLLIKLKKTMDPHHLFNPGRCLVQENSQ